ncbi:MAG: voltage-gated potassium channel protein [Acetobacteraceae bacterium]
MTAADPLRRLRLAGGGPVSRAFLQARRRLHANLWFPHAPLFLLVGLLGLILLRRAIGIALLQHLSAAALLTASRGAIAAITRGAPSAVVGAFLLVMAFGLLSRSRFAWVIALIGAATSFLLIALSWAGGPAHHADLLIYNGFVLAVLLAFGRTFGESSIASATLFAIVSTICLLVYAVLGSFLLGQDFAPPIGNFVTALYYVIVTMSTVGFGDIVPKTNEARLFTVSIIVLGITIFATSLSALLVPMISHRMERLLKSRERFVPRSNHYIVIGDSALARNTLKELKARDQPVTLILPRAAESDAEQEDVVVGDATDLEVLRRAEAKAARAILALGADDSENAFVVMAAKELAEHVQTVAAVNDARNMERVKRVHPDLIIAPQVLGGELLAMALSGEPLESERVMQQLLHFNT